jgi:hypothetical protein
MSIMGVVYRMSVRRSGSYTLSAYGNTKFPNPFTTRLMGKSMYPYVKMSYW